VDRRRFLLTSLAGALAAPLSADPQTSRSYRVAMLGPFSTAEGAPYREAFFEAMRALGYVQGRNVIFDVRVSDRDRARVPTLVDELIALKPDVLVGDAPSARVMRAKTTSIPIVLAASFDPVGDGLAQSLRQPGMNVTGVTLFLDLLSAKHVDIMREILPRMRRVGLIFDTTLSHNCKLIEGAAGEAARAVGAELVSYNVATRDELARAFSRMGRERPEILLPCPTPLLFNNRDLMYETAARLRIPFTSFVVENVPVGVLFSYGPSFVEGYRKAATYVHKILNGAQPGDLPIEQPTTFELVINLQTAKMVGLTIPPSVMLRSTRVIE
jgi:putative tryptophan/tyrosine transport system substrate-binding protein